MKRGTEYAIPGGSVHAFRKVVNMVVSSWEACWRAPRRAWQCGWMRSDQRTEQMTSIFYASTPKNQCTNGPIVCFLGIHLAEWLPRCERTCGNGHAPNDGEDVPCKTTRLIRADAGIRRMIADPVPGLILDTRCSTEASDGRELRQRLRQAHWGLARYSCKNQAAIILAYIATI